MSAAANGVVCDEPTYEASKDKISYFKKADKIKAKGFALEVKVYTPHKIIESGRGLLSASSSWANGTFIGRAKEKTLVANLMQKLKEQSETMQAKVIILEGEG